MRCGPSPRHGFSATQCSGRLSRAGCENTGLSHRGDHGWQKNMFYFCASSCKGWETDLLAWWQQWWVDRQWTGLLSWMHSEKTSQVADSNDIYESPTMTDCWNMTSDVEWSDKNAAVGSKGYWLINTELVSSLVKHWWKMGSEHIRNNRLMWGWSTNQLTNWLTTTKLQQNERGDTHYMLSSTAVLIYNKMKEENVNCISFLCSLYVHIFGH